MNPALDIQRLTVSYGTEPVLKGLSFAVLPGSFFIILGPNGSGKTTLLKTLAGLVRPDAGQVRLGDHSVDHFSRRELAKSIALVPQTTADTLPFTVREMVRLGRAPHSGILGLEPRGDRNIVEEAMAFTDVSQLADRRYGQLSGGERQRVSIARAISQEPEIMLLDEPTSALDMAHQIRVMNMMARLKREKRMTVVMVSHDLNLAAMYGEQLLILNRGTIASIGSPDSVLTESNLESIYGCRLLVDRHPNEACPRITLTPEMNQK